MKLISVVTPCFNEEENVEEVYRQVKAVFGDLPDYAYEHLFIDNASTDGTVAILRRIAQDDANVKVIVNTRNFGPIRSPFHGLMQASGDAVVLLVADLQDPPGMIRDFVGKWEQGYKIAVGVKPQSEETRAMYLVRSTYYSILARIADIKMIKQFTGFGLYDRAVIELLRTFGDPYPYFRGMVAETGYDIAQIPYVQPARKRGIAKNNFYALYDWAMLGITSHSRVPIRLAIFAGATVAVVSFLISVAYLILKLIFWQAFTVGVAPILIGFFFLASVQLLFIGVIGEYVGAIHTQVLNRPLVVERERINFS